MTSTLERKKSEPAMSDTDDWHLLTKFERFNRRCEADGLPPRLIYDGLMRWGKFRYANDGFIYKGRCKRPISHYLRITRVGRQDVALNCGRLGDLHEIERWRILMRMKKRLLPELRRREKELKAYARSRGARSFSATVDGKMMSVKVGARGYATELRSAENPNLGVLDQLGNSFSEAEADRLAKRYSDIQARVHRGWVVDGVLTDVLARALDDKLALDGVGPAAGVHPQVEGRSLDYGKLVEATINGRVYPIWIGRGGFVEPARHWPSPLNDSVNFDRRLPE